ncbi:MAG: hypothetical protein U1G07_02965 [Verrucomicrobiota bacterium]
MNNILQWEPDKSRLWANARIENIHRIREDLATLAEWVRAKAELASLTQKADLTKVNELEKILAETQNRLDVFKKQTQESSQQLAGRIEQLERFAKSSEATLAECLRAEADLRQLDNETRETAAKAAATVQEQASAVIREVEQAQSAAAAALRAKEVAAEINETLRTRADEFVNSCDELRRNLASLSAGVEERAAEVLRLVEGAQQNLSECQANARDARELHANFATQQQESVERLGDILRQTEAQADRVAQHARETTAASELAARLQSDCAGLISMLQLKSEELSSTGQNMERELAALVDSTQANASAAADSARETRDALTECQNLTGVNAELKAALGASEQALRTELTRVEGLIQSGSQQAATTAGHLEACRAAESHISQLDSQLRAWVQGVDEKLREAEHHLSHLPRGSTFWGRLKWLLTGTGGH